MTTRTANAYRQRTRYSAPARDDGKRAAELAREQEAEAAAERELRRAIYTLLTGAVAASGRDPENT